MAFGGDTHFGDHVGWHHAFARELSIDANRRRSAEGSRRPGLPDGRSRFYERGPQSIDQLGDLPSLGARCRLITRIPRHVGRRSPVACKQVLVEVGHASADDGCEHELRIERLPQCRGELGAEATHGRSLLGGQVGEIRRVSVALDIEIPERSEAILTWRGVIDPEAFQPASSGPSNGPSVACLRRSRRSHESVAVPRPCGSLASEHRPRNACREGHGPHRRATNARWPTSLITARPAAPPKAKGL